MHQLNLQIYGRTAATDFNEQLSARRSVALTPDPIVVELPLDAPAKQKFNELRLDPDDKISTFVLHSLNVRSASGVELYRWDGDPGFFRTVADLRVWRENSKTFLESCGSDPFLLIPLDRPQSKVVVEVCVSQALLARRPGEFDEAWNAQQREVAEALWSLQSSVRLALDGIAADQEGLQDAVTVGQAHARSENEAAGRRIATLSEELARALQRCASEFGAIQSAIAQTASQTRDGLMLEVREIWRSLNSEIAERSDATIQEMRKTDAARSSALASEIATLRNSVELLAGSNEQIRQVRHALQIAQDEDVLAEVNRLKADAQAAQQRLRTLEASLSWRVTRPLRALSRQPGGGLNLFRVPHKP